MDRQKRYFIKQKLIGVVIVLFAILTIFVLEGDATAALLIAPMGLVMIFTKKMVWTNDYWFEVKENEEEET